MAYRYSVEDFQQLLKNFAKGQPAVIFGDLSFLETNWKKNSSSSERETSNLKVKGETLFRQAIHFPTCSHKKTNGALYVPK